MSEKGKYSTGNALRAALEERLKQIAKAENTDLQRLRRWVAFDRFLARLSVSDCRCDPNNDGIIYTRKENDI